MAKESATAENAAESKPGVLKMLMVPVVVGLVCGAVGFGIPIMFPALVTDQPGDATASKAEPLFLKFGEVVVNLNDARLTRYLRISISLQITANPAKKEELQQLIESKRAIMTSWLLGYLADMTMDDIRGAAGQNRLRREINDQFNWVLFPEGEQQVDDVLFEEFNVQ